MNHLWKLGESSILKRSSISPPVQLFIPVNNASSLFCILFLILKPLRRFIHQNPTLQTSKNWILVNISRAFAVIFTHYWIVHIIQLYFSRELYLMLRLSPNLHFYTFLIFPPSGNISPSQTVPNIIIRILPLFNHVIPCDLITHRQNFQKGPIFKIPTSTPFPLFSILPNLCVISYLDLPQWNHGFHSIPYTSLS